MSHTGTEVIKKMNEDREKGFEEEKTKMDDMIWEFIDKNVRCSGCQHCHDAGVELETDDYEGSYDKALNQLYMDLKKLFSGGYKNSLKQDKSGMLVCPKCKSEIASDNVETADIDCDCGQIVTKETALKIVEW